jgi:flagellar assembly protein FliH
MSTPAKFMFDIDFAAPKPANAVPLAEHQVQVGEAESRGYRNGFAEGQREAQGETARRLAIAMEDISRTIERLSRGLSMIEQRVEAEAVEVAVATGRKLATELVAREPFAEIQSLATACFRDLVATPHVVVRLNDALYEDAQKRLAEIARQVGFDGRLLVLAEPDIAVGDCRIEWADGGMTRNQASADQLIGETVRRFLEARRADAEQHVKGTSDE